MKINEKHKIILLILALLIINIPPFLLKAQKSPLPDILLITVDALRADHLGCYGYQRATSPNIDRLAKEGAVFTDCFVTGSGTTYSLPGLLTGRYLEIKSDYTFFDNILDEKLTTLAEYMKSLGYYTTAFIDNGNLTAGKGFEQGFDNYWNGAASAREMTKKALNFLNSYKKGPIFVWVHYIDPHTPYDCFRNEDFKIFKNDRLYKENDKILRLSSKLHPYTSMGYIPKITFQGGHYNLNYYIARYDAEIRYTDLYIGRLLNNINDDTIVMLTADHGEFLGEHNYYFAHGEDIYDEVLRVPLIIKDNRYFKGGKTISTVVSSVDIVPTILSRISPFWYFLNKGRFDGLDLKEIMNGKDIKRKYVYSYFPWAYSIRDIGKNVKYISDLKGREELYFLPDEHANRINDKTSLTLSIAEELRKDLKAWLRDYPIPADINRKEVTLTEDVKNTLRSLGYLQ